MNTNTFKPIPFKKVKEEWLSDPDNKKYYYSLEEEFSLVETIIKKRLEKGLTQKELAKKIGTQQSSIARLESGSYNPSFKFLVKLANALGSRVQITFTSKM